MYVYMFEVHFYILIKLVADVCSCRFFSKYNWLTKTDNYSLKKVEIQTLEGLVVKHSRIWGVWGFGD